MAGLLDFMGSGIDDPRTAATLQLAQGLLAQRGMGGLVGGMQGYLGTMAQAKEAERRKKLEEEQRAQFAEERALRMQQLQRAMAEQEAQRTQAATDAGLLRTQFGEQAGPTQDGAPVQSGAFNPRMFLAQGGSTPALMTGLQLQQALTPAQKKRNIEKVGDHLVEVPEAGAPQTLWSAPEKAEKPPSSVQEFLYGQKNPAFDQWLLRGKQAAGTKVTVNTPFETEYQKGQGKTFSETMGELNRSAFNAPAQLNKLTRMEELLKGVDGGKFAPAGLEVASALNSLGIKVDPKLGNKEAAESLARDLAGSLRTPGTGPMTDKDFENFMKQVPSLSKSAEGRAAIIQTTRAALQRDVEVAKLAREYERRTGRLDNGFMDLAAQFVAANPVVQGVAPTVVRTGRDKSGRKVEQLSDGSVRYAD